MVCPGSEIAKRDDVFSGIFTLRRRNSSGPHLAALCCWCCLYRLPFYFLTSYLPLLLQQAAKNPNTIPCRCIQKECSIGMGRRPQKYTICTATIVDIDKQCWRQQNILASPAICGIICFHFVFNRQIWIVISVGAKFVNTIQNGGLGSPSPPKKSVTVNF